MSDVVRLNKDDLDLLDQIRIFLRDELKIGIGFSDRQIINEALKRYLYSSLPSDRDSIIKYGGDQ